MELVRPVHLVVTRFYDDQFQGISCILLISISINNIPTRAAMISILDNSLPAVSSASRLLVTP